MNIRPSVRSISRSSVTRAAALALGLSAMAAFADHASLPPDMNQGGIPYISGGIGSSESEAMKAQADHYSLALTFAEHVGGRDVYLASVPVVIRNAKGETLLDVVSEGPYLLTNLAAGSYRIVARHGEDEKSMTVRISPDRHERLAFVWAGAVDKDTPSGAGSAAAAAAELQRHLPAMKSKNGISYLTGGIGSPESQAIKAELARHSLGLTFASQRGGRNEYLAAVQVAIRDTSGAMVLEVLTEGPYLLVDLPAGSYRITATYRGKEKQSTVRVVADRHAEFAFLWQDEPAQTGTPSP